MPKVPDSPKPVVVQNGELDEEVLIANRMKLLQKMSGPKKKADKQWVDLYGIISIENVTVERKV